MGYAPTLVSYGAGAVGKGRDMKADIERMAREVKLFGTNSTAEHVRRVEAFAKLVAEDCAKLAELCDDQDRAAAHIRARYAK
jgi:hypothetical protein